MHMCILLFSLFDLSFVAFPSVLWYCWLGLLKLSAREIPGEEQYNANEDLQFSGL